MNHLKNAIRKSSVFDQRQWVGFLLPMEILALSQFGITADFQSVASNVLQAGADKESGKSASHWFYFTPCAKLRKQLNKRQHNERAT